MPRPEGQMRIRLAEHFAKFNIDAYITPLADNHLNEFVNDNDNFVRDLTGFTGTAGTALDFKSSRVLHTDGRYYEQAERELKDYSLIRSNTVSISGAIIRRKARRVGVDPRLISHAQYIKLSNKLRSHGIELRSVDGLLESAGLRNNRKFNKIIDIEKLIYQRRGTQLEIALAKGGEFGRQPSDPDSKLRATLAEHSGPGLSGILGWLLEPTRSARALPGKSNELVERKAEEAEGLDEIAGLQITGASRKEKLKDVRKLLGGKDGLLFAELDTIAWIFNLRGSDIKNNAVFYSYAYITQDRATLFANGLSLLPGVTVRPYEEFESFLDEIADRDVVVSGRCNAYIGERLRHATHTAGVREMQSLKNWAELYGMLQSNLLDGAALVELFEWIEDAGSVSEKDVDYKLIEIKADAKNILGQSFDTIVAFGVNGSEHHHTPTETMLDPGDEGSDMILIDSGSQYIFGTTDITRSLSMDPSADQRRKYTLVLKALLAAKMLTGDDVSGEKVDETARKVLEKEGITYNSATGHGVGAGLFVHEKPPAVDGSGAKILENQVFTIEPGYYEKGKYGIRIEDSVVATSSGGSLSITSLTYIPYHLKLIEPGLLTKEERVYLNKYNRLTRMLLESLLKDGRGRRYLLENTKNV